MSQRKTIFSQHKKYGLFLEIFITIFFFFLENNYISHQTK